jgi:hypothetical protein
MAATIVKHREVDERIEREKREKKRGLFGVEMTGIVVKSTMLLELMVVVMLVALVRRTCMRTETETQTETQTEQGE